MGGHVGGSIKQSYNYNYKEKKLAFCRKIFWSFKCNSSCVFLLPVVPTSPLTFALSVVVASTELTANWSPPVPARGHITAYTLYCNSSTQQAYPEISSGAVLAPITVNGDSNMRIITGLTPYTSYDCQVTASTTVGEGPPSNTETETTAQAGTVHVQL